MTIWLNTFYMFNYIYVLLNDKITFLYKLYWTFIETRILITLVFYSNLN